MNKHVCFPSFPRVACVVLEQKVRFLHPIPQPPDRYMIDRPRKLHPQMPCHGRVMAYSPSSRNYLLCQGQVPRAGTKTPRTSTMRQFRGSITRLGARCLRFVPSLPSTKQDSLTAGGLPLPSPSSRSGFPPNGFTYRLPSIRSPFHGLRLAQLRSDPKSF